MLRWSPPRVEGKLLVLTEYIHKFSIVKLSTAEYEEGSLGVVVVLPPEDCDL